MLLRREGRPSRAGTGLLRGAAVLMAALLMLGSGAGISEGNGAGLPETETAIEKDVRTADLKLTIEKRSTVLEGETRPPADGDLYRIAMKSTWGMKIGFVLETEAPVQVTVVRKDGSGEKQPKQSENGDGFQYILISYEPGNEEILIRIRGEKQTKFVLTVGAESPGTPVPEPTLDPDSTEDPDPSEDPEITPEPEPDPVPYWGGGGGSYQPHSRNTAAPRPEYDQLDLSGVGGEPGEKMRQLKLGKEILETGLEQEGVEEEEEGFTLTRIRWAEDGTEPDTLILTAAPNPEGLNTWYINGAVLRRLKRSGIDHLVLRSGENITVVETEGFISGWEYDRIRSRGAGSRWFDYTAETREDEDCEAAWRVTIDGREYSLDRNEHSGIRLTEVYEDRADALEGTWEQMMERKKTEEGGETT